MEEAAKVLLKTLEQNSNHPKIKQTLHLICQTREKITFHAFVSSNETYIQVRGLSEHNYDEFNHINKMLHSKIAGVIGRINRRELDVRDRDEQQRKLLNENFKQQNRINEEMMAQVEHVINNVDLPLSLFKLNDKYWYHDNPKTVEAKKFVQKKVREENVRKERLKSEFLKRETQKSKMLERELQHKIEIEAERKRAMQQQLKKKIEEMKSAADERSKAIKESQRFGSSLKPLYKIILEDDEKIKMQALEERKKKLSEIRQLHRSIDMAEIQEHKNKLLEMEKNREMKKILNDPLKVSFKSKYHTSMTSRSRVMEEATVGSLYEKKMQFGSRVREEFKPKVNEKLVEEMEERLKILKRKRVRKNPKKNKSESRDSDEEDDSEYDSKPQTAKKQPLKNEVASDSADDEDSEEEEKPAKVRGEDEDPDRHERYELGVKYLEYVRSLKKKTKSLQKQEKDSEIESTNNGKNSSRYKNYLQEFSRANRTIDSRIDTSRMKREYNKSIIESREERRQKLESEAKKIEEQTKREQQIMKLKRLRGSAAVDKKVEIDNAVLETIKVRLAMMQ